MAAGPFRQMLDSAGNPPGDPTAVASMPVAANELSDGSYGTAPGMSGDTDVLTQRFIEVPSDRKKARLLAAKGLRGQESKAFMDGCLA